MERIYYYTVEYTNCITLDFEELAEIIIEENEGRCLEALIEEWKGDREGYFQLVDFWDGGYLTSAALEEIDTKVIEALENLLSEVDN